MPSNVGQKEHGRVTASIDVCISTMCERLLHLEGRLPVRTGVRYLIGHQCPLGYDPADVREKWSAATPDRDDIRVVQIIGLGLSKNRNVLIEASNAEIVLFADDDIDFLDDFDRTLRLAHEQFPSSGVITFQTESANRPKQYVNRSFRHSYASAMRVSSIEISAKRAFLIEAGIRFDENFGLGTYNPSGEEFIFTCDCIRARLSPLSFPESINRHDHVSSGADFYSREDLIRAKGRMFKRGLPSHLATLYALIFAIKKYPTYKHNTTFTRFSQLMLKPDA